MEGTRGGEPLGTKKRGERDGVWMGWGKEVWKRTNKQGTWNKRRGGTDGRGRGRGPGTRKRTKEATEQAVNDGSGFLIPYPRIKRMRVGVLGTKTLLQQLLGRARVWPGRRNRVISVHEE